MSIIPILHPHPVFKDRDQAAHGGHQGPNLCLREAVRLGALGDHQVLRVWHQERHQADC